MENPLPFAASREVINANPGLMQSESKAKWANRLTRKASFA
jgi:hypothetical protein